MRGARTDANSALVVEALRASGITAEVLNPRGRGGVPDLVVGYRNRCHLVEIKVLGRVLNARQIEFIARWNGCVHVAHTSDEAIRFVKECHEIRSHPMSVVAR